MDQYQALAAGLADAFTTPQNYISFLILMIITAACALVIWLVYKAYQNQEKEKNIAAPEESLFKMPPRKQPEFNAAQQRILNAMIADFKRREMIAEAIPASVLERFAEYFYRRVSQLQIPDKTSVKMVQKIYPIQTGDRIEIEILYTGRLAMLERKVLIADGKAITINEISEYPIPIKKGIPLGISYFSNNSFISGEASVLNVLPNKKLLLTYPKNLKITDSRRYSRMPVQDAEGTLTPAFGDNLEELKVILLDIGLEGVRVRCNCNLSKKMVYRLNFVDLNQDLEFDFTNFECIVSRAILSESGFFEYGLAFVYLDLNTRAKLNDYLQKLADRLRV